MVDIWCYVVAIWFHIPHIGLICGCYVVAMGFLCGCISDISVVLHFCGCYLLALWRLCGAMWLLYGCYMVYMWLKCI